MNLVKTSLLTSISTSIKILSGFIINKVVSVYIGPSGLALIGQFQSFISIVLTFSNAGINNGIIKYLAQYYDKTVKQQEVFRSGLLISLTASLTIGSVLLILNNTLSQWILDTNEYKHVFTSLGFSIVLFSLNTFLMSVLNGTKQIKKYVMANIVSSIVSLILICLLVYFFQLKGALYALVLNQSIVFFFTLLFVLKSPWFSLDVLKGPWKKSNSKLLSYSIMAIVTATTTPITHIYIRDFLADHISWEAAGYWQGTWKISEVYLLFITTSLSVYYLPKLSALKKDREIRKEIFNGYKIILPITILLALGIYLFRNYLILLLFTKDFMEMRPLFLFQLIGDVLKIMSWMLSYLIVAKSLTKWYVISELFFALSFILLSTFCIRSFGLIGATYAFAISYLFYFSLMVFLFRKLLFGRRRNENEGNNMINR